MLLPYLPMDSKPTENQLLRERMDDLESSVQAFYRLFKINPYKKPRNDKALMQDWAKIQGIGAKKEWDEEDTTFTIQFAWYLTQDELRRLEWLTKHRLCWVPLLDLLDLMRRRLIATEDFEGNHNSHTDMALLLGALDNLSRAGQIYLLRYAPEIREPILKLTKAYHETPTPDFSPAAVR